MLPKSLARTKNDACLSPRTHLKRLSLAATLALCTTACQGTFASVAGPLGEEEDTSNARGDDDADGTPGGGPEGNGPGAPGACDPHLSPRLLLLSDFQHASSLRALLGEGAIEPNTAPERSLKPFAQKGVVVSTSLVHTRAGWAERASEVLRQDPLGLTGCTQIDEACVSTYLRSFVPRAFRRPVAEEEIADLMAVYQVGATTSPLQGLIRAVEATLSAPSFMIRRELGVPQGDGTRHLDEYEIASAISFGLTDAPPDETLRKAAESGALADPEEIKRQVDRLLELTSVQESLTSTLISAWGLSNLFGTVKDPGLFPEFTPSLQRSMLRETELFVTDVLWDRKAALSELLSSRTSFVDGPLAKLYGLEEPADPKAFSQVTLPEERAGLLTQPGIMTMLSRSDTTSVVARGLFVRGLLCMPKVGAPPESLAGEIAKILAEDTTERERAEARAKTASCAGCHAGIDPFGVMLESFDPLGRYRTTVRDRPIDTSVEVQGDAAYAGSHKDAASFLQKAAQGPEFSTCVATRLLSYASQDEALAPSDCSVQAALDSADLSSATMPEVVRRVFTSPALWVRKEESP